MIALRGVVRLIIVLVISCDLYYLLGQSYLATNSEV